MKYVLIEVPDDFEKGQCYDCSLYVHAEDCCVLHCRYDECPLEIGVSFDKMKSEIEQTCSWYCFDDWGNKTVAWDAIESVIDKYAGGKLE